MEWCFDDWKLAKWCWSQMTGWNSTTARCNCSFRPSNGRRLAAHHFENAQTYIKHVRLKSTCLVAFSICFHSYSTLFSSLILVLIEHAWRLLALSLSCLFLRTRLFSLTVQYLHRLYTEQREKERERVCNHPPDGYWSESGEREDGERGERNEGRERERESEADLRPNWRDSQR